MKTISLDRQYRSATFVASPGLPDGTLEVVWTTGSGVERWDWDTGARYWETLSLDASHVRLDQLNAGAPLLDTHRLYDSEDVIGHVEDNSASMLPTEGRCKVVFDMDDPKAAKLYRKAKAGHLRGVSVGYDVHRYDVLEGAGPNKLPTWHAVDWTPREISICPIGADSGAGVRQPSARAQACSVLHRNQPAATSATPRTTMSGLIKRGAMEDAVAAMKAYLDSATLKSDNDKELAAYKLYAIATGNASTPSDPPAEDVVAIEENAQIAEAARSVTGLKTKTDVIQTLYSMTLKGDRNAALTTENRQRREVERKTKLDRAVEKQVITPARRALLEDGLKAGRIDDEWLDKELAVAVPQIDNATLEPPVATNPGATRGKDQTPEDVLSNDAFKTYCKRRGYDEAEAKRTAQSWVRVNGNRPFEMPERLQ